MKNLLKKAVLEVLKFLAKVKINRMKARIIGVSGSVGKTTCKDAIFDVLSVKYRVLKNEKSYNSEFGLLLTILHQESGFSSAGQWIKTLARGFVRAFFVRDRYDFLVLEMGVDKPGDMDFLTSVVKPDFALITAIKPVHMAEGQFSSLEDIYNEKKKIFENMKPGGFRLVNIDDEFIKKAADAPETLTYGTVENSLYQIANIEQGEYGLEFDIVHKKESVRFKTKLFGDYWIYVIAPATILGMELGVPAEEIKKTLNEFELPPGRLSLIEGKKGTLLLDSTYNASPEAVSEALKVLNFLGEKRLGRKIFVFGNMNELGALSKELHHKVGEEIPKYADMLITVGNEAGYAASAANKSGMDSANIFSFKTANEAAEFYKKEMKKDDTVLVKGSQNKVRLEIFVKELMVHPETAKEKLVRQDENWQNIKP
jgi:UDP-N-acetylmuramoyl-tripeptide--D-alanyl-D-alanine ligase